MIVSPLPGRWRFLDSGRWAPLGMTHPSTGDDGDSSTARLRRFARNDKSFGTSLGMTASIRAKGLRRIHAGSAPSRKPTRERTGGNESEHHTAKRKRITRRHAVQEGT